MLSKLRKQYSLICYTLCLFALACANQIPPSGGNKDTTAPILISSSVPHLSTNVKQGQKIKFSFDEFIQLKDAFTHIQLLPHSDKPVKSVIKGKDLIITLPNILKENTTYSLTFHKAITNLTEGITMSSVPFAFSTGNHTDTSGIYGIIQLSGKDIEFNKYLIGLFAENVSMQVRKDFKTEYYLSANEDNQFSFHHIPAGMYHLFAFKDQNGNKKYDPFREEVAFTPSPIATNSMTPVTLDFFREESDKLFILKYYNFNNHFTVIKYNKPPEINNLVYIDTISNSLLHYSIQGDSVLLWHNIIHARKRILINNQDTIDLSLNILQKKKPINTKLNIQTNISNGKLAEKYITLRNSNFFTAINKAKITLWEDSKDISNMIQIITPSTSNFDSINIKYTFQENKKYILKILPKLYTDIYTIQSNDSITIPFTILKDNERGSLRINSIKDPEIAPCYILIKDASKKTIYKSTTKLKFPYILKKLLPGKYTIEIHADNNDNGKIDSGKLDQNLLPEKIYHYKNLIDIKASFETQIDVNMNSKR